MKFYVNILLIIVILAATVIPLEACQEQTSMDETLTNKTVPLIDGIQRSIIVIPDRNTFISCGEGQKKDRYGRCREVI